MGSETLKNDANVFPSEAWVSKWVQIINEDSDIARLGKFFNANVMFEFGDEVYILSVYRGTVTEVLTNPIWDKPWDFAVRASFETWSNSIKDVPPPFYQDIFGMMWNHGMVVEGDAVKAMQNIRVLKLMLAVMKQV